MGTRARTRNCRPASSAAPLFALLALLAGGAWAQGAGEVTQVSGALMASKPNAAPRVLGVKSKIEAGELLTTGEGTYAQIKFTDGAQMTLRPNTQLRIEAYQYDQAQPQRDNFVMNLIKGGLRTITGLLGKRKPNSYALKTVVATVGIRGTHYGALLCQADCGGLTNNAKQPLPDGLHVDVAQGAIDVTNQGGQTVVTQGSFGYVPDAQTLPRIVPPSQGTVVSTPPPASRLGAPVTTGASNAGQTPEDCIP
jgi:hypothetical protein